MRRSVTELVGTFLLVFVVAMVVLSESPMAPLAIGGAVAALVYAGYHVSGGHYNPAVTLAALVRGLMSGRDAASYCVAHLLGGALGAATAAFLVPDSARPGLAFAGRALAAALVTEFVLTFALVWVVLHVATAPKNAGNSYYGLAIAAVVVAGVFAGAGTSGGVVNPAVAVALAVVGVLSWSSIWVFLLAQLTAAVVAARLFGYCVAVPAAAQAPAVVRTGRHAHAG